MRFISRQTAAAWLVVGTSAWAAQPVEVPANSNAAETAPQSPVERRVERRELRRENAADLGRAAVGDALRQGANIQAPGVNVQVPPAGSGRVPTVQTPRANVTPGGSTAADPPAAGSDIAGPRTDPGAKEGAQPSGERWRYRWHNGQWWYWLPNNRWVFWNGYSWLPYAGTPAGGTRYTAGYGPDGLMPVNPNGYYNSGNYAAPNNGGYYYNGNYYNGNSNRGYYYRRPGLIRNRLRYYNNPAMPPTTSGAAVDTLPPRGAGIEGGGGEGLGGPIGSRNALGIRTGGASAGQSSGTRARANLGAFGEAGGTIGGSGAVAVPNTSTNGALGTSSYGTAAGSNAGQQPSGEVGSDGTNAGGSP